LVLAHRPGRSLRLFRRAIRSLKKKEDAAMDDRRTPHTEKLEEAPLPFRQGSASKLQLVRDLLAERPETGDAEIVAALAARGVEVPADYPATIREQGREEEDRLSAAVREELARTDARSEQVVAALQKRGIHVAPEYVETIRAALQQS
jgi:hypothetical protein